MYSYEIRKLLEAKQYLISMKEYEQIIKSSQVDHVLYKGQQFHIWTTDGYYFKLTLKREH